MAELILHIGAHKTATTALQRLLSQSEDYLARENIVYPRVSWFQFAQHRLAFSLKNMMDPAQGDRPSMFDEIENVKNVLEKNPGKRILLSSEELFSLRPDALEFLRSNLSSYKVRIIACVRRPDEMLLSIYNQKAKTPNNGFSLSLVHFLQHPRAIDPDISYGEQLGKWMDCFGEEALSVFNYEDGEPIDSFFTLLGIEPPAEKKPMVNRSVSAPVVEIMRLAKVGKFDPALQQQLYHLALKHFEDAPNLFLSDEARSKILMTFKDEYDVLFARLGRSNPYLPDILTPQAEASPSRPNLTFLDLMALIQVLMK